MNSQFRPEAFNGLETEGEMVEGRFDLKWFVLPSHELAVNVGCEDLGDNGVYLGGVFSPKQSNAVDILYFMSRALSALSLLVERDLEHQDTLQFQKLVRRLFTGNLDDRFVLQHEDKRYYLGVIRSNSYPAHLPIEVEE